MVSSVYTYYLSQYGNKTTSKYDSHKKSDLKNTYNKILKINRNMPSYKLDLSEAAQRYAIDLKEHARDFGNIAASLSGANDGNIAFKKSAVSDNSELVEASFIGESSNDVPSEFSIEIKQLATPQINTGNYLPPATRHLNSGEYSFDLAIGDLTYEFQFGVEDHERTGDIQGKIARLINRSNIGLKAEVVTDRLGSSALTITSDATGTNPMKSEIFHISNNTSSTGRDCVDILGLNRVSQYPSNAIFEVDGNMRTSKNNTFTVNNAYELTLKGVSDEGSPVRISLKNDSDNIIENISELVDGFNRLVTVANDSKNGRFDGTSRLKREFSSITHAYGELLSNSGLNVNDNGTLEVNRDTIESAVSSGNVKDIFQNLGKFKNAVQGKAEAIALNPMEYVNNKIVAYKNPGRALTTPYYTSAYAGMMFNGYI